jgi:hypothetical protein
VIAFELRRIALPRSADVRPVKRQFSTR